MNKITIIATLTAAAIVILSSVTTPAAVSASPLDVNLKISGYLPAPPGVRVHVEGGRPYYMEKDRRVYVEKDRKHHKNKHRRGNGKKERGDHRPMNGQGKH